MKSVKKVVLPMVLVAMAALTACGGEKSAENQTDCKVAYAENGEWYSWIDRDAKWGKEIFKDNNMQDMVSRDATDGDVGEQVTKCEDKKDPEYCYVIYNIKGHESAKVKLMHYTNVKMEEKYSYVVPHDEYLKYDSDKEKTEN